MPLATKQAYHRRSRGFSLTEFAIVLAIMGIVLSALWGVVSIVRENINRAQMKEQMVLIVNNVRDFHMARMSVVDPATNSSAFGPVTDYLLRQNVLLPEQIRDRAAGAWLADHPWGSAAPSGGVIPNGGVAIRGGDAVGPASNVGSFFTIELRGLKLSSCIAMAAELSGSGMPEGLASVLINGAAVPVPVTPDAATGSCIAPAAANDNTIGLVFALRKDVI